MKNFKHSLKTIFLIGITSGLIAWALFAITSFIKITVLLNKMSDLNEIGTMVLAISFFYIAPFLIAVGILLRNQKKNFFELLFAFLVYAISVFGVALLLTYKLSDPIITYKEVSRHTLERELNNANQIETNKDPLLPPTENPNNIDVNKFTHPDLPGFEMTLEPGWQINLVKEFKTTETEVDISSNYFPKCDGAQCMHVSLWKGDTLLKLNFDIIYDDSGYRCIDSRDTDIRNIGGDWYHLWEGGWHIYTYKPELNVQTKDLQNIYSFRNNDEYETFRNPDVFDLCSQGHGAILAQSPPSTMAEEGAIMMEFPHTEGPADKKTLDEVEKMITSIKGLE